MEEETGSVERRGGPSLLKNVARNILTTVGGLALFAALASVFQMRDDMREHFVQYDAHVKSDSIIAEQQAARIARQEARDRDIEEATRTLCTKIRRLMIVTKMDEMPSCLLGSSPVGDGDVVGLIFADRRELVTRRAP